MRNMVLIMILVSFSPLILLSGIIGYHFETSYHEKTRAYLKELVLKHQQNINIFLNEKLSYIRVMASSFTLEQLSDDKFLERKLAVLRNAYGGVFVDLGVVNEQGVQIAYAGGFKLEKANYSEADWFKKAITRPYYISDVFLGLRRQPHFIVSVKESSGGKDWILRATIDFEAFNSLVESIHVGKTGSALIMNRQGEFQTEPRLGATPDKDGLMRLFGDEGPQSTIVEVGADYIVTADMGQETSVAETREVAAGQVEYGEKEYIYVLTPLKSGEWILIYLQEASDAFSDLQRARNLALFIFLIGGLGIVSMAFFLSRRMVEHIERADQEKEMMNEQVIEAGKLASVGELAAGIAHEINNPVAIMVEEAGWIQDLLEEEDLARSGNLEEFERALKQIKTQGSRCKEITHKLLSFARKTDPTVREVELNELIEEIVSISEQRARYSNVRIGKSLEDGLPLVQASPSELQQVFLNLINNAIDAIGTSGGTIDITTRMENKHVIVDVADNGPGIPKAILARVFDPFFTTKPVGKGTGLGLSICYGIVKKMGGDISVNSAVGMGTTFHVYLPLPKNGSRRQNPEAAQEPAGAAQMQSAMKQL
jgi:two-component system NtrC family sensor kinase